MSDRPRFVYVIYIAATPDKVWRAMTDAEMTARYLSGFHVATDLRAGGASLFKHGDVVLNRGVVLSCEPPHKLSVTWQPVQGEFSDEKPSRVTFDIEAVDGNGSRLTITHDDFQEDSRAAGHVGEGWTRVAASLKSFVETGKGMDLLRAVEGTAQ